MGNTKSIISKEHINQQGDILEYEYSKYGMNKHQCFLSNNHFVLKYENTNEKCKILKKEYEDMVHKINKST